MHVVKVEIPHRLASWLSLSLENLFAILE